jgi:metallo-beta-lactamase class B
MIRTAVTFLVAASFFVAPAVNAQSEFWRTPFEAHRVIGPLYSVGTYDLSVFLLTTSEGHILINTGMEDSTPLIKKNIEDVGFRYEDVKVLMTMQAHLDHVAATATVKRETGAEIWATPEDAILIESGGATDHLFGGTPAYDSATVERRLKDGEVIKLGDLELTVIYTPGHTNGSSSYAITVEESGKTYDVLIANMNSVNPGTVFVGNEKYPQIAEDYAHTFAVQKQLTPDIWVSAHASQYQMHDKFKPGDSYDPERFVDPAGYKAAVADYEQRFRDLFAAEK